MAERNEVEIWELTIPGRVSVFTIDKRGNEVPLSAKGRGSRLRLTTEDRLLNEERCRRPELDPFSNGMLVRVGDSEAALAEGTQRITDDELKVYFEVTGEDFENIVRDLTEVNIRRLKAMTTPDENGKAEYDASASQIQFLDELIAERYAVGGTVPSWEQMQRDRDAASR